MLAELTISDLGSFLIMNNFETNTVVETETTTSIAEEWYLFEWQDGKMRSYYQITQGNVEDIVSYLSERYEVRVIEPKQIWSVAYSYEDIAVKRVQGKLQKISLPNWQILDEITKAGGFSDWSYWNRYDTFPVRCNEAIARIKAKNV